MKQVLASGWRFTTGIIQTCLVICSSIVVFLWILGGRKSVSLIENDRNDDILGSSSDTTIVPDGIRSIVLTG